MSTPSTRSRFILSLGFNLLRALLSFITGMVVARSLGPEHYGTMMFLLSTFIAARGLLDMGSSTAFFTFLSQRTRSGRFVAWYVVWLGVQFLLPLVAIGFFFPASWVENIWKSENRSLVIMALFAAYAQSALWPVMSQMGESQRLTGVVQAVSAVIAVVHLLLMSLAWWQEWLGIELVLIATAVEWSLAAGVVVKYLKFSNVSEENDNFRSILREFWLYCAPMVPYAWLSFFYEFFDRWLLQSYGGSVQQAYYTVASQFSVIAALATSSVINIFWKEIAEANHQNDMSRVIALYRNVSRGLFFIAASVSGFFLPWSVDILSVVLGPAYVGGAIALTIMFLYPLHQCIGQINGTMLYATGRVKAQVTAGMLGMGVSILASYFVLAPPTAAIAGFALGSVGLAGKMVIVQFISVNAVAFYLSRSLRTAFDWRYQPAVAFVCIGSGWIAYFVSSYWIDMNVHVIVKMAVAVMPYLAMLIMLIWLKPSLTGLNGRQDLVDGIRRLLNTVFRQSIR